LSKTILREPGAVRPWQQEPLRQAPAKSGSSVLAALTTEDAVELKPNADAGMPSPPETAEQLLQQAQEAADRLRAAAVREGYADGQARGLEEFAEERQRLRDLLACVGEAYRSFCLSQAPELAGLAAAAAEKLLYEQLSLEPERVLVIVRQSIEQVVGSAPITIHLNPADIEFIRGHLMNDPRRNTTVQLTPDTAVEPGGCWIESDHGEVDATVSGRVSRLKDVLSEGRETRDEG
jgi:flagellar assembly protein FliH